MHNEIVIYHQSVDLFELMKQCTVLKTDDGIFTEKKLYFVDIFWSKKTLQFIGLKLTNQMKVDIKSQN